MSADKELVRLCMVGSVDDGKSTLLGRLLYDLGLVPEDQREAMEIASKRLGRSQPDMSLLLDGLSAEREQGITIDVAYRYFETASRRYIVADAPGHEQYTRNMVTGCSTAEIAVVLVDASKGLMVQTKRHAIIASLMHVPHLVVAVNKMDLVDYDQETFDRIANDFREFSAKLEIEDIRFVPVSAIGGDNVAGGHGRLEWYSGQTFQQLLDDIHVASDRNLVDFRLPVQRVIRSEDGVRYYAGTVASGSVKRGEEVLILPGGQRSKIKSINGPAGVCEAAMASDAVGIVLQDERDISRGDMIVRPDNVPYQGNNINAMICWMDGVPLDLGRQYVIKHTTRQCRAWIRKIHYVMDVNALHRLKKGTFELNDIGRVELESTGSLFFDSYSANRETGSFILIDPDTNATVAAGMVRGPTPRRSASSNVVRESRALDMEALEQVAGHKGAVIWMTGLSGSGKSTLAKELLNSLYARGCRAVQLDGDNLRHGLCGDLGFSVEDRKENIRRVGEVSRLFCENANIAVCCLISPFEEDRNFVRSIVPEGRFIEVYVKCDIEECRKRDPKGLYKKAEAGEIKGFTGIDAPYEEPEHPEITVNTVKETPAEGADRIFSFIKQRRIVL